MTEQFSNEELKSFLSFLNKEQDTACIDFWNTLNRSEVVSIGITENHMSTYIVLEDIENNQPFTFKEDQVAANILLSTIAGRFIEAGVVFQKNEQHHIRFHNYYLIIYTDQACNIKKLEVH